MPVPLIVHNFLGDRRQTLLEFVLGQEQSFRPATVALGAGNRAVVEGVRRARILDSLGDWEGVFLERLREHIDPAVEPGLIEIQVTASNDGDYFRLHVDGGPDDSRALSFVYFLHSEPRPFSGGELRIRESSVVPQGDTLVFFPSSHVHEVLPVHVPSRAFADSRFTVNGWIHRQQR